MVRKYQRKTDRSAASRSVRVRYQRRDEIDAEKVAEVLIRIALRQADDPTQTGRTGDYLRGLLTSTR
ncbi:hypothetical protein GCM10027294_52480 [Marinactinospora endophytica]